MNTQEIFERLQKYETIACTIRQGLTDGDHYRRSVYLKFDHKGNFFIGTEDLGKIGYADFERLVKEHEIEYKH